MRVIIAGMGGMGEQLLVELTQRGGHEIVVIDPDEERCDQLADTYDALVIHGDATSPDILEKAQIDKADGLVAATGYDPINTIVGVLAHRQGVERVVVRLSTGELRGALEEIGISEVIEPYAAAAAKAAAALHGSELSDLSQLVRGGLRLGELQVGHDATAQCVRDLDLSEECIAVAVLRGQQASVARPDLELEEGDVVVIVGESEEDVGKARA